MSDSTTVDSKALNRERNFTKWLSAPFRPRQYRGAIAAVGICGRPLDFLRRYAAASGNYPTSIPLRTPTGQVSLEVYSWHDARTIHEIFLVEDYRLEAPANVIVDYGSNIGISAAYFLSRHEGSYAYLFEPVPSNIERLRKNLRPFEGRYHLEDVAVGLEDGRVSFGIEETGRYGGINQKTGKYLSVASRDSNTILAEILARHGKIDVLKIDVETMEQALVEHLTPELASRINLLLVESHFDNNPLAGSHTSTENGTVTRFQLIV